MSAKMTLFDDSDGNEDELHINKGYADNYENWRRGEELQKLKDRFGDDAEESDSESSSDGDFVEPDNPEFDKDFLLAMGALHQKGKDRKNFKDTYFKDNYGMAIRVPKEEKPMTLKDYERHVITERAGKFEDEVSAATMDVPQDAASNFQGTGFKFEADGNESEDSDGGGLLSSGLFKIKDDSEISKKRETSKSADKYLAYLKGQNSVNLDKDEKTLLTGLKQKWNNPGMSHSEKWLADYFLSKRYLEDDSEHIERAYNEAVIDEETISEDEATFERMENFETKYRFRYEEPDTEFIKQYPRIISDSLRPKNVKRKTKRDEIKKRKTEEKECKRQEVEQLKALKYQEICSKIERIKKVSGHQEIDLGEVGLEGDFDPESHDAAMAKIFSDDYYGEVGLDEGKPMFEDEDDLDDIICDYDDWMTESNDVKLSDIDNIGSQNNVDTEPGCSHVTTQMEVEENLSSRKRRRQSKFAKALARKKPKFDPQTKGFEEYFDEYYKLDFEDIVGGVPCRFRYRNVDRNDFGLSTGEILSAQDAELNRWFSLKKMMKYSRGSEQEKVDKIVCQRRASNQLVKEKIFPSLFAENQEEVNLAAEERKKNKNLKKKLRKQNRNRKSVHEDAAEHDNVENSTSASRFVVSGDGEMSTACTPKLKLKKKKSGEIATNNTRIESKTEFSTKNGPTEKENDIKGDGKRNKKRKVNKSKVLESKDEFVGISDARLLAYGENPKKLKNKVKYGKTNFHTERSK